MNTRIAPGPAAFGLMVLLCAIWGFQQVAMKFATAEISPILQAGLRSGFGAVLVYVWARWRGIALLFERFASDVAQPARRPVRAGAENAAPLAEWLGRPAGDAVGGDPAAAQLEFTRKSPSGRDDVRLGYRLNNDKIELLLWPVLDRAPSTQPEVYVLLEGVSSLRFRHLDSIGRWQDIWPVVGVNEVLPRAVAIEVTMQDGVAPHRLFALPL